MLARFALLLCCSLWSINTLSQAPAQAGCPRGGQPSLAAAGAGPTADPGAGRVVEPYRKATLNGAGSTDPGGLPLSYRWQAVEVPEGSSAQIEEPESVTPSIVPDLPGRYVVQLTVENCAGLSNTRSVALDTTEVAPVANAGPSQKTAVGAIVQLDGSASTDTNGMLLSYQWTITQMPNGSLAALSNPTAVRPVFTADLPGTYVLQLTVFDGTEPSSPATLTISTGAIPPTAQAGANQHVSVGAKVTLSGAASTDPNGKSLTYAWSLLSIPAASKATLTGAATANPTFVADVAGNYVAQLIVSDSYYPSAPSTVLISTGNLPPVANPGATAWVKVGSLVTLDGSQSADPQGLGLTYSWSFVDIPASSQGILNNAAAAKANFTADEPGTFIAELIVSDGALSSAPQTVVVYALYPPAVSVTLNTPTLITYSSTSGAVHISNPAQNTGGAACKGQIVQISLDNGALGTLSTSSATVATSVCIPTGMQDAPFTLTTNSLTGSTTLTAFLPDFQVGTLQVTVNPRTVSLSFDTTSVGQGRTANGTVTLANPAPSAGVTLALATSEAAFATVTPAAVTIRAGATTAVFKVNALKPGQTAISATAAVAGYTSPSTNVTVLSPALTITIPHGLTLGPGQALPFPVSIGAAATAPVQVSLATTAGPGGATFSPSVVTIAAGATTPATQPNIVGGAFGNVTVKASANGYAPDIEVESIAVSLTLDPASATVEVSQKSTFTLSATSVAPAGGFAVNMVMSAPSIASVPATVTIPAGASTVQFQVTGVAPGTVTLTASGSPGISSAKSSITVIPEPAIGFDWTCPTTAGMNSIAPFGSIYGNCFVQLGAAAPPAGKTITISSSNSKLLLLSLSPTGAGAASVTVNVPGGQTYDSSTALYMIGLASTGTATVTAAAPGFSSGSQTVTLIPSGFIVTGGAATTTLSDPSTVSVVFTALDPTTFKPVDSSPGYGKSHLRAGAAPVAVSLKNDNIRTGALGASTLTVTPTTGSATTTYTPANPGTSNISIVSTQAGYATPSPGSLTTQFTVTAPPITFQWTCPSTAGLNTVGPIGGIYGPCYPLLSVAAPSKGATVTVSSSNPKLLLLSLSPSGTGTASVTIKIPGGQTYDSSSYLYMIGLASTGAVTVTASAPSYASGTQTVTLIPSGFTVTGGQATTTFSTPSTVNVNFTALDPATLNPVYSSVGYGKSYLRAGAAAVAVSLKNDDTKTGALGATTVTLAPSNGTVTTTYTPANAGTSNIGIVSTPPGYATPAAANLTTQFTVTAPPITFQWTCPTTAGLNTVGPIGGYYGPCYPLLGVEAPSKGEAVTVTSSNPKLLLLSLTPNGAGSASVTINIAGGQTYNNASALYFIGLAGTGTVTVTASAPGYASGMQTVSLIPSGFIVTGGQATTTFSDPSTVSVTFTALDPATLNPVYSAAGYAKSYLRAGAASVPVSLKNDNTKAGALGTSSLTLAPNNGTVTTIYTPANPGTSNISIAATPPGYASPAASNATTQFTVTAPPITFYWTCPTTAGLNTVGPTEGIYGPCFPQLGVAAPAKGETITVTSSNPKLLLLSLSPNGAGSASVSIQVAGGQTYDSSTGLYMIGLASSGTVTVTASASGYASGTQTVTLIPSGFVVTGGAATTTFSDPSTVTITFTALDPVTLNPVYSANGYGKSHLRAGAAPVVVSLKNDNTKAGVLGANTVTVTPTTAVATTAYTPANPGTSNISIAATPAGYATPAAVNLTTQFTVTAPPITFYWTCPTTAGLNTVGPIEGIYGNCFPSLGAAAPAKGETVTVTSSNPKLLLLSLNPNSAGSSSVTIQVAAGQTYDSSTGLYLIGLASSGTATLTASAPGYANGTQAITLIPSGFTVSGGQATTTFSDPSTVNVTFTALDPATLNPVYSANGYAKSYLRAGAAPVVVPLKNDNTGAGTLGASTLTLTPVNGLVTTTFKPASPGTSNISVGTPSGYAAPSSANLTTQFVVTAPPSSIYPVTVGKNLMATTYGTLGIGVPSDNYAVTISVASSAQLLLSATGTDAGVASLTFKLGIGQAQTPQFWVYGIGNPGTAVLNISAPGYAKGSLNAQIDPSGFVFQNQDFTTTLKAIATTIYIQPAALDPQYLSQVAVQPLRPGMTNTKVTVVLTDQPSQGGGQSKVGKITVNPVVFNGADNPNEQITSFQPIGVGQTLLKLSSTGFSNSASEVTATVTQ